MIEGIGPAPAIRAVLKQTGLQLKDIDLIEVSAFGKVYSPCSLIHWRLS